MEINWEAYGLGKTMRRAGVDSKDVGVVLEMVYGCAGRWAGLPEDLNERLRLSSDREIKEEMTEVAKAVRLQKSYLFPLSTILSH